MSESTGVVFPLVDGRRSTATTGRAVVADALREVDPVGAGATERETNWRAGYLTHFRRLVEAGLPSSEAALTIARDGLASVHSRMRWGDPDAADAPLARAFGQPSAPLVTEEVRGSAEPERELSVPYRGNRLRGDDLRRQVDEWVASGVAEPSLADVVGSVIDHPEWLALPDRTVVVLGAAAEMGPLRSLLRWGGTVAGVDLPRAGLWERVLADAGSSAGRLLLPARPGDAALPERAGGDLVHDLSTVASWVRDLEGPMVLGNYVYADGAANVRVSCAVDALTEHLHQQRDPDEVALAFLATPTDVFAVPGEAVAAAVDSYARRRVSKALRVPLRTLSGGRLLRRNYVPGVDPGINDSVVPQQGPNYLLAKRLQRWRAAAARDAGATVSFHIAPPTRTRSVVKNRALAAAYAGAHRFGIEVFEPGTSNTLMAALLVHDVMTGPRPTLGHPWQDEAHAAVHGGLWRAAYDPRSALGLAALLGVGASR
jgi:hypothetical protein